MRCKPTGGKAARPFFTAVRYVGALGVWASVACGPSAGGGGVVPTGGGGSPDGPRPTGAHEGESADELKAKIIRLRGDQEKRAIAASADKVACHDVCGLTAQICEASEKLCEIADRRPSEESYQGLCREAQLECREATLHCETCVGGHATPTPQPPAPPPAD